ncbi:DUF3278 domain-containing protein [Macrococcoides caseolyticum]|uniref:DUF3278 domain-containing protein n=1 Tax=Macrococcoides caseolyticum TaxID=69966 RepID=UPI0012FECAED|nr:DUF3278 domain-containing protein [Macrococcus caseolyticus]MDJ1155255.1 DUF3278 domain-containing protein [Macrococcus caseolyticus]QPT46077.1 DUF3278 domain-containing protein [Macrococcus caseolyticus]QQB04617.1 DUF3278 domain-containing protein [Macrococcus caseolyticus]
MKILDTDYLSSFMGLDMTNDEYQRQQGYIILANCFNYLFYLIVASMFISLIWDISHQMFSTGTILMFLILQGISIFIINQNRKTQSDITEVYSDEDYQSEINKLKRQSVKLGLYWGTCMYVMIEILFKIISGETYEFDWFNLFIWIIGGLFFGLSMYFIGKMKIKKATEDEVE